MYLRADLTVATSVQAGGCCQGGYTTTQDAAQSMFRIRVGKW